MFFALDSLRSRARIDGMPVDKQLIELALLLHKQSDPETIMFYYRRHRVDKYDELGVKYDLPVAIAAVQDRARKRLMAKLQRATRLASRAVLVVRDALAKLPSTASTADRKALEAKLVRAEAQQATTHASLEQAMDNESMILLPLPLPQRKRSPNIAAKQTIKLAKPPSTKSTKSASTKSTKPATTHLEYTVDEDDSEELLQAEHVLFVAALVLEGTIGKGRQSKPPTQPASSSSSRNRTASRADGDTSAQRTASRADRRRAKRLQLLNYTLLECEKSYSVLKYASDPAPDADVKRAEAAWQAAGEAVQSFEARSTTLKHRRDVRAASRATHAAFLREQQQIARRALLEARASSNAPVAASASTSASVSSSAQSSRQDKRASKRREETTLEEKREHAVRHRRRRNMYKAAQRHQTRMLHNRIVDQQERSGSTSLSATTARC